MPLYLILKNQGKESLFVDTMWLWPNNSYSNILNLTYGINFNSFTDKDVLDYGDKIFSEKEKTELLKCFIQDEQIQVTDYYIDNFLDSIEYRNAKKSGLYKKDIISLMAQVICSVIDGVLDKPKPDQGLIPKTVQNEILRSMKEVIKDKLPGPDYERQRSIIIGRLRPYIFDETLRKKIRMILSSYPQLSFKNINKDDIIEMVIAMRNSGTHEAKSEDVDVIRMIHIISFLSLCIRFKILNLVSHEKFQSKLAYVDIDSSLVQKWQILEEPERTRTFYSDNNDFRISNQDDFDIFVFAEDPGKITKNPTAYHRGYYLKSKIPIKDLISKIEEVDWDQHYSVKYAVKRGLMNQFLQEYIRHHEPIEK